MQFFPNRTLIHTNQYDNIIKKAVIYILPSSVCHESFLGAQLTEGTDFEGVDELVNVSDAVNSLVIRTIFRPGAQSRRSFTVYLLPDASLFPTHSQTLIQGTVTINILDNSSEFSLDSVAMTSSRHCLESFVIDCSD